MNCTPTTLGKAKLCYNFKKVNKNNKMQRKESSQPVNEG